MPGGEKLVTFQGANGNLTKSPYTFKQHSQSGKYVSDLIPNLAELADEMCFLHSMPAKPAHEMYGTGDANPTLAGFARNCLLARRLLEYGVRFVQLFNGAYAMGEGVGNWDGHKQLKTDYDRHGPILDKPLAALLKDLKRRGLLNDTLVVWSTEFGRM